MEKWVLCKDCGTTYQVTKEPLRIIRDTDSDVLLPRYCANCQVSFFDPKGLCPICHGERGVTET